MGLIKAVILQQFRKYIWNDNVDYRIILLATFSIFLPFILCGVMLVVLVILIIIDKNKRNKMLSVPYCRPLFVFMVPLMLVPFIHHNWVGVATGVMMILVLLFLLYAAAVMTQELLEKVMQLSCMCSIYCAVGAIIQDFMLAHTRDYYRPNSVFMNPNYYGTMIEFILLICVYKLIFTKENKWFYYCVILINMFGLFLADCQSAWIPIFVGICFMLVIKKGYRTLFYFVAITLAGFLIAYYSPDILPRLGDISGNLSRRMGIWKTSLKGIQLYPFFGQGLLTYIVIYPLFKGPSSYHAHNIIIDPILNFGLVGSGILLIYFIRHYFDALRLYLKDQKPQLTLLFAVTIAIGIHGMSDITIQWIQTGMFVAILMGAIPAAFRAQITDT